MASYLVQEVDGTSRFILEDSSGDVLLETSTTATTPPETALEVGIGIGVDLGTSI